MDRRANQPGSLTLPRAAHVVVLLALLVVVFFAVCMPADVEAAGSWTTGILTSNSVSDVSPRLTSTHLVWAQEADSGYNIQLRELSTGATETIGTIPHIHIPPLVSIGGDYVVIWAPGDDKWQLYKISSSTTQTFPIAVPDAVFVYGTDGTRVVGRLDDGHDTEIVVYDIAANKWINTNNEVDDLSPSLSSGRLVWETAEVATHRIMCYEFATGVQRTLVTLSAAPDQRLLPYLRGDWVAYRDPDGGTLCLCRLTDGLVVEVGSISEQWILTDRYLFWTQDRPCSDGNDLYAFSLQTFVTTQLTSDDLLAIGLSGDGNRLIYWQAATFEFKGDLMVVDMAATSTAPFRLASNIEVAPMGGGPRVRGDLVVASLYDGHDFEITHATWAEGEPTEPSGPTTVFSDVPSGHPYRDAIYYLAGRGVILGYEDGTFRPNDVVTRQQFAKMIVKALGLTVTGSEVCPFTDVAGQIGADPFYPSKYVAVCAAQGITSGKTATTFAPGDYITHQQLITMVVRAAELLDPPLDYAPSFTAAQFSLDEHYQNARRAAYAGLLDGLQGMGAGYDFLAASTRGECAQLLHDLLKM